MAEMTPHVPDIPPDAHTAAPHAAPPDLSNPPSAASPSTRQPASDDEQEIPQTGHEYKSPEPIEAMYAQTREDSKRLERLVLLTLAALLFLLLYMGLKARQAQAVNGGGYVGD